MIILMNLIQQFKASLFLKRMMRNINNPTKSKRKMNLNLKISSSKARSLINSKNKLTSKQIQ